MIRNGIKSTSAYKSAIWHLKRGNLYTKVIAIFLGPILFIQKSKLFSKLPIINTLVTLCQKLIVTHKSAWKFEKDHLTKAMQDSFSPSKVVNPPPMFSKVVIIGSGPGAVCAARYIAADDYIVLESGNSTSGSYGSHNLSQVVMDFQRAGQEIVISKPLIQFGQGKTLGGGSEVNSGLYHQTPTEIAKEWKLTIGATEDEWLTSQAEMESFLNVNQDIPGSPSDSMIARSALELGYEYLKVPRWRKYEGDYLTRHYGMRELFWHANPRNIYCGVEVTKIKTNIKNLEVISRDSTGKKNTIHCEKVILCAGTVSTPLILSRSRLIKLRKAEFNLHVMLRSLVKVPKSDLGAHDIDPFQSWSKDHTLKYGSAVSSPSLLSPTIGREIDEEESKGLRAFYVSFAPKGKGGFIPFIRLPYFKFNESDRKVIAHAAAELCRTIDSDPMSSRVTTEKLIAENASTVHIFGSLPIGGRIVNEYGELRSDKRVIISDGSILPTAPLVNPQGPIMTLCNLLAKRRNENEQS
jgi:hypothetical protein